MCRGYGSPPLKAAWILTTHAAPSSRAAPARDPTSSASRPCGYTGSVIVVTMHAHRSIPRHEFPVFPTGPCRGLAMNINKTWAINVQNIQTGNLQIISLIAFNVPEMGHRVSITSLYRQENRWQIISSPVFYIEIVLTI